MNVMVKTVAGIVLLSSQFDLSAEEVNPSFIGWVGLWNGEMVRWAENENQIASLCPKALAQEERVKCKAENLAEKVWTIGAYTRPDKNSRKAGEILITVKPGDPFVASFKSPGGEIAQFEPDLYDQDWGYGPYFHQTILEQKGDWLEIPLRPFTRSAWIHPGAAIQRMDIIPIRKGPVYELDTQNIVITDIGKETVSYRSENSADMWCNAGAPPKPPAGESKTIRIRELFSNGHLKLDIKYKRGC